MFFLKKVFQLRDKANPDLEKPFLEHLEDLRITLTRMTLVLLATTIACFVFRNDLMDIIKKPVTDLYDTRQVETLKDLSDQPDPTTWEAAIKAAHHSAALTAEERESYYTALGEEDGDLAFHTRSIIYYNAAQGIPDEERRSAFIDSLAAADERMPEQVRGLLKNGPETDVEARGRLVLMQALNPTEGFMLSIKLAFFAGIVTAFPFLLFFLLQFTLPGLHDNERRALYPAMAVGFGLFLGGVFFAYYQVLPRVLEFFHTWSMDMGIRNEWRIGYYISFATQFVLIFGLSFELPVVVMTLVKLGIMNYEMMKRTRAYAILAIFVIAAIITPTPDAFTLCLLAMPMIILYEICIWLAFFMNKKEREEEEAEEKARMERLLAAKPKPAPGTESAEEEDEDVEDHDPYGHEHYDEGHYDEHDHYDEHGHPVDDDHPVDDHHEELLHRAEDDGPVEPEFDFHEEVDPGATEEGEEEDISDPWDDDEDDGPPEDIPEEEKNRE